MANPIICPGVYFTSFKDITTRSFPWEYIQHDLSIPSEYIRPKKHVDSPRTSYHIWLDSIGSKLDAVEQRKYLLRAIRNGEVEPVDVGPPKDRISKKKEAEKKPTVSDKEKTTDAVTGFSGEASSKVVLPVVKTTPGSKTVKTVKKMDTENITRLTSQVSDISSDDELADLSGAAFTKVDDYIFDSSTIQNTVLPNTVQMRTYRDSGPLEEKKTSTVLPGVTPATEEQVFDAMFSLNWCDKDDSLLTLQALNRISTDVLAGVFPTMTSLANDLFCAIHEHTGALDDMKIEERYNFLFHIIAKGNNMYYQTIADPEFCLYLLEQYQPLYTFMKKRLKMC